MTNNACLQSLSVILSNLSGIVDREPRGRRFKSCPRYWIERPSEEAPGAVFIGPAHLALGSRIAGALSQVAARLEKFDTSDIVTEGAGE